MITEVGQIDIKAGSEKDFEAAVARARAAFTRSKRFLGFELHRSIEKPERYWLFAKWDSVEDHMIGFRNSSSFTEWRSLVGPYFASPTQVEHTQMVVATD